MNAFDEISAVIHLTCRLMFLFVVVSVAGCDVQSSPSASSDATYGSTETRDKINSAQLKSLSVVCVAVDQRGMVQRIVRSGQHPTSANLPTVILQMRSNPQA